MYFEDLFWGEEEKRKKLIYLTHTSSETLINLFRPEDRTENADWKWLALIYGSLSSLWCKKSLSTHRGGKSGRRRISGSKDLLLPEAVKHSVVPLCLWSVRDFAEHTKSLLMKTFQLPNHHPTRPDPLFHSWHVQIPCFQTLEIQGGSTSGYWYPVGRQSYSPQKIFPKQNTTDPNMTHFSLKYNKYQKNYSHIYINRVAKKISWYKGSSCRFQKTF